MKSYTDFMVEGSFVPNGSLLWVTKTANLPRLFYYQRHNFFTNSGREKSEFLQYYWKSSAVSYTFVVDNDIIFWSYLFGTPLKLS